MMITSLLYIKITTADLMRADLIAARHCMHAVLVAVAIIAICMYHFYHSIQYLENTLEPVCLVEISYHKVFVGVPTKGSIC